MSASAIVDGMMTTLSATSNLGLAVVSKDYRVLESSSACACVISVLGYEGTKDTFGQTAAEDNWEDVWTFSLEFFLKAQSPSAVLDRLMMTVDKVVKAWKRDETIQGTCDNVISFTCSRTPGEVYSVGGHDWVPFTGSVKVREWT